MPCNDAEVYYCENFFTNHEIWYDLIDNLVDWQSFPVKVFGKIHKQPRMSFYMADVNHSYRYAGFSRTPEKWSIPCIEMKEILFDVIKQMVPNHPPLNAVLGNKYRDGLDYIGKHSDDERDLNNESFICSVSLGATRDFVFTHKKTKKRLVIPLKSGSVILMGKNCQQNFKHEIPKRTKIKDPRINLTFRSIIN